MKSKLKCWAERIKGATKRFARAWSTPRRDDHQGARPRGRESFVITGSPWSCPEKISGDKDGEEEEHEEKSIVYHRKFRGIAARLNYLVMDKLNLQFKDFLMHWIHKTLLDTYKLVSIDDLEWLNNFLCHTHVCHDDMTTIPRLDKDGGFEHRTVF